MTIPDTGAAPALHPVAPDRAAHASRLRRLVGDDLFVQARALRRMASREELRLPYPLVAKLGAWRRGFTVENAVIYGLDRVDSRDYLSDYARVHRCNRINPVPALFDQKLLLRRVLADRGFAQPETVALVTRHGVVRDPVGDRPCHVPIERLERELVDAGGSYIVKPQDGMYGRGIARLEVRDGRLVRRLGTSERPFDVARDAPPNTLVERALTQHAFWDGLSPSSVNTLRILTLWTPGDPEPFIGKVVQRIGTVETLPTDNWDTGGLLSTVDTATGRLGAGRIHPFRSRREDRPYTHHPDTGARIEGAELPYWSSIVQTALAAARSLPMAYYVGWDVAVDPDGRAVFIEGNKNTGVRALQADRGLLTDPAVRRFYRTCGVV